MKIETKKLLEKIELDIIDQKLDSKSYSTALKRKLTELVKRKRICSFSINDKFPSFDDENEMKQISFCVREQLRDGTYKATTVVVTVSP